MILFSSVLGFVLVLAFLTERSEKSGILSLFFTVSIVLILSLLSGLRTSYNDTYTYIKSFIYRVTDNFSDLVLHMEQALGDNPGFYLYQYIIIVFISNDPQVFLFLSALITNIFFVFFYKKYSPTFAFSLFLYFTSGLFILGMAAIKQMMATAIIFWAISFFLKNKHITFIFLILIASTIHPFSLFYFIVYLVNSKVWTKMITLFIFLALLTGPVF